MKETTKAHLRTAVWILGGAAAGLAYYTLLGCRSGCAITSSPLRTMAYFAAIGWLLSGVLAGREEG